MHRWGGIHRELLGVLVAFLGVVVRCWRDKRGLGEWVCGDGGLSFGFLWGGGGGGGGGVGGGFLGGRGRREGGGEGRREGGGVEDSCLIIGGLGRL